MVCSYLSCSVAMLPPCGAACVENSVDGDCLNPAPAPTLAGACSLLSESHPKMSALNSLIYSSLTSQQSTPPADTDPEETSREPLRPPASPLIQTKSRGERRSYWRPPTAEIPQASCTRSPASGCPVLTYVHKTTAIKEASSSKSCRDRDTGFPLA
ncbi:hypothetical protein JZ751_010760 [Albula glossodonta]|uniref:Uncharacterized protein n=1 Tax=Albula glossodonta TaxID=121402 RepID=A0A8T2MSW6_9TELE|nr:hypothetical protein JZ751_010760 [Albula glossodonta]